jgi:hypothetical protein
MKRLLTFFLIALGLTGTLHAQPTTFDLSNTADFVVVPDILSNSISNLHAEGDSLWVGPYLNLTVDGGRTWLLPEADSLFGTANRLYSIDVEGSVVWAGLGYTATDSDGRSVQSAGGILYSTNGGTTFTYLPPPLDAPGDSTVQYGVNTLKALPVIVPQQSPPYDIDYDPVRGDVWVAMWAGGVRRSSDFGATWQRVVLPPDELTEISPDQTYNFHLNPRGNVPEGSYNHTAFSVLVDEVGTIWVGTPMGVNISNDGGQSWRRVAYDGSTRRPTGSWILSIEEQPLPGRNTVWMATYNAGERGEDGQNGVTISRDGGNTFEQMLIGTSAIDFAFRGETVYVAARGEGLLISDDGGVTWRAIRDFYDRDRPDRRTRPGTEVNSVAVTSDALWIGTTDGLFKSTDEGRTWTTYTTNIPLHPASPTPSVPDVETYAYPNPFSPANDGFVRIRYEGGGDTAEIRVYDFGMNLVRSLFPQSLGSGDVETTWDGTDDRGLRVANGVYFYAVRSGGKTSWGKILVLE